MIRKTDTLIWNILLLFALPYSFLDLQIYESFPRKVIAATSGLFLINQFLIKKSTFISVIYFVKLFNSLQLLISCNRQSPVTNLKASLNLRGNSSALINPLVPNAPFLYPLKTSENLKGALGTNGLKSINNHIFEHLKYTAHWNVVKLTSNWEEDMLYTKSQ